MTKKITIEFIETNEELIDESALLCAIHGQTLAGIIWNLDQHFRNIYKYSEKGDEIEFAENARDKIRELLDDDCINIDKLYY